MQLETDELDCVRILSKKGLDKTVAEVLVRCFTQAKIRNLLTKEEVITMLAAVVERVFEKYDHVLEDRRCEYHAALEKQRAECDAALQEQRCTQELVLEKQRVERDAALEKQRAERDATLQGQRREHREELNQHRTEFINEMRTSRRSTATTVATLAIAVFVGLAGVIHFSLSGTNAVAVTPKAAVLLAKPVLTAGQATIISTKAGHQ